LTHYLLVQVFDPKGREYLIVVLPTRDEKALPYWPWEVGVLVLVGTEIFPLHAFTLPCGPDAAAARKKAADLAKRISEGELVQAADIYTGAR